MLLNRNHATAPILDKRRDAENAERRKDFRPSFQSPNDVSSRQASALRLSAVFAPPRFSGPILTAGQATAAIAT